LEETIQQKGNTSCCMLTKRRGTSAVNWRRRSKKHR
jgi:hypothetical protein